jgi:hypothetical protein
MPVGMNRTINGLIPKLVNRLDDIHEFSEIVLGFVLSSTELVVRDNRRYSSWGRRSLTSPFDESGKTWKPEDLPDPPDTSHTPTEEEVPPDPTTRALTLCESFFHKIVKPLCR